MRHKIIIILLIATIHIPTSVVFAQKSAVRLRVTTDAGIPETTLPDASHHTLPVSNKGKESTKRSFSVDNDEPVADPETLADDFFRTNTIIKTLRKVPLVAADAVDLFIKTLRHVLNDRKILNPMVIHTDGCTDSPDLSNDGMRLCTAYQIQYYESKNQ